MRMQKTSPRLFRLIAVMAILVLAVTQMAGVAQAKDQPPTRERVQISKVSLDGVQSYYGRLADVQGPLGVVVELQDTPSALVYADAQGASRAQAATLTKNQTSLIQQKQADLMATLSGKGIQVTELYRTQKVFNGIWMRVDTKDLQALAAVPGIKAIYPMIPKVIDHTTSVPLVGAPEVWAGSGAYQGETISIGIIDTGIDYIHTNYGGLGDYTGQDFTTLGEVGNLFPTAKVVGGWDFAGDDYDANDDLSVPVPDPDPMDCNGHGSHVAGSAAGMGVLPDGSTFVESIGDTYADLAALTPSAYQAKFRIGPGVAPKAELYALRVFGCAGSTNLTEQAIEWAMDPNGDLNFDDHLDIINMSLGSGFGSEYDASAIASNNAATAGVIVVTSAGNSGDVYYINGAPGVARNAISVANSVDGGAVVSALEVTAAATMSGTYPAVEAGFGSDPGTPGLTGNIALASPANGCTAITGVSGQIALIDRGTCTFVAKVKNAQDAGAVGVLVANNVAGFPFVMGGTDATITIPSMMTTKAVGDSIKADLGSGTVTVRLTSEYRDQFLMTDSAVEDTLVASSSRGVARGDSLLKPDLAAPGDSIYSAKVSSGNEGISYGGTSMASPHVAGIMALLFEMHPTWSVAELKALVMNTATNDVYQGLNHTGNMYTPSRVGTGRASVANAVGSEVIAYYKDDPGQVSLAFGQVQVVGTMSFVKELTIENTGLASADYNVTFDSRYAANPGLTFILLDSGGSVLSNPVTVPASGTLDIQVQVDVDASLLTRALDPTVATGSRQRFSEGGGYVTLTSTGSAPTLRVSTHIAARPASSMSVSETSIALPAANTGTFSLTPTGTEVDLADDTSLVTILELMGESPDDVSSTGLNDAADLRYIGAMSDYPYYAFADSAMFFGVATYGKWDTANAVEFDIYIDADEDGTDDYVIFNTNQGFFTATTDDVMFSVFCPLVAGVIDTPNCDAWYYVNTFSGNTNTNLFSNNVMVLPVPFVGIGLVDGVNTDFDFHVVTFNRDAAGAVDTSDVMSYDVANQSFMAVDPNPSYIEEPIWYDVPAAYPSGFEIDYNKAAMAANNSTGLLLLHHHNAVNTAEVIPVSYSVTFSDVPDTYWAWSWIESLYGAGITGGCGSSPLIYCPAAPATRAEMAVFLLRGIHGSSYVPPTATGTVFTDVPGTYWAADWIEQLKAEGITSGCGVDLYCPNQTVTRAEMAIFLLRSEHGSTYVPPTATGTMFTDVPGTYWAVDWIEQLAVEGITSGCGAGTYCPGNPVTRAEMAVFLVRTFGLP